MILRTVLYLFALVNLHAQLSLPANFEVNQGQFSALPAGSLLARGRGYSLLLSSQGPVFIGPDGHRVRMEFPGAVWSAPVPGDLRRQRSHYVGGPESFTNVPHYERATYSNIYPGIDLLFHPSASNLEYDFLVHPHANPALIRMRFPGASSLRLDDGHLLITAPSFQLRHRRPSATQPGSEVPAALTLAGNTVGFRLAPYDAARPLLIDPVVEASTLLGGTGADAVNALAVDSAGNIYAAGYTSTPTLQLFVTKVSPDGKSVLSTTYVNGTSRATPTAIAIDSTGAAVVAGYTYSDNLPTTPGVIQPVKADPFPESTDGFILKVAPAGSQLLFATFLGGTNRDFIRSLALDAQANIYIAGLSQSVDFPLTAGAFRVNPANNAGAFVARLNPSASALLYAAGFGAGDFERVLVDPSGAAVVVGNGPPSVLPTTSGAYQPAGLSQNYTGYVAKLNAAGSGLQFATFFGGLNSSANVMDAGLDAAGNIYLSGTTASDGFPTTANSPRPAGGAPNAFIAKLNPSAGALLYAVIPGKSQAFTRVAVEPSGTAHFLTNVDSDNVTITGASLIPTLSGISSAVAFGRLSPNGDLLDSSFWYAPGLASQPSTAGPATVGLALTLAAPGSIVFGGYTTASGLPVTPGAVQPAHASPGQNDGFLSRLSYASTCAYSLSTNAISAPAAGGSTTLSITTTPGCPWAASASDPWIETQILSDSQLRVSVVPVSGLARNGSLFVAGKTIPVTQNQNCAYGIRFAIPAFPATGGQLSADIVASPGCPWSPTSDQPWLTLSAAGQTLTLFAPIHYGSQPRTATLTIAPGVTATIRQEASSCRYTVTPAAISLYPGSREFSVSVTTATGCVWNGSGAPGWVAPQQIVPAYGSGTYTARVDANNGPARSATLLVAGTPVLVTQAASAGAPTLVNAPIPNFQGLRNTVSFTATDQDGAADIARVYFLVSPGDSIPAATCHGFYDAATRGFFLYSDGLSQLLGPAGVLQNSQCQLSSPASNASAGGNFLSVNLDLTLRSSFAAAPHNVYVWAVDRQGNNTGWVKLASWRQPTATLPQPPGVRVFAIPALTGPTQDIAITVDDPDGGTNVDRIYFLVNPTPDTPANSCHGYFDRAANAVFLYNDPLTDLSPPLLLNGPGSVQNSQCRIDGGRSAASASATTAFLNLNITLTGAFAAKAQTVFAWAVDQQQLGTGWIPVANWRAATLDNPPTLSGAAASLAGNPATLAVNVQDLDGPNNIDRVYFLIAPDATARQNVCYGYYERASNTFFLTDDNGANPAPLAAARNSQCLISTASGSGAGISLQVMLRSPFAARIQRYYFLARDLQGNESGWMLAGVWTTGVAPQTQPPAITAATPANPSGSPQTFSFKLSDADGVSDIDRVYFLIASTTTVTPNTCHGFYDRAANAVFLYDDALTSLASLRNSQCAVSAPAATTTATELSLSLTFTLNGAYGTRAQNVFLFVNDKQGKETGWVQTATWIPAAPPAPPSIGGMSPATLTGSPQPFTVTARDANGAATIQRLYFLINSNTSIPVNTCHGFYDRPANAVYLYNDSLTSLASLQNSQCAISAFSASVSGTDLTLNFTMSLTGAFATASRNIYFWARDVDGNDTGWVQAGTWAPGANRPPAVIASPPSAPLGPAAQLVLSAQDPDGAANISRLYFLINTSATIPANTCHGFYDRSTNAVYLYNDALSAQSAPLTPGTAGFIQNGQCAIDGATTTLTAPNPSTVALSLGISVPAAYRNVPRGIYLWAEDSQQNGTGWVQTGTWARYAPEVTVATPPTAYFGARIDTAFPFRHSDGETRLRRIYFLIAPTPVVTPDSCHGFYDRASGQLYLYNDALTALGSQPNSQCDVTFRGQPFSLGDSFFLPLTINARGTYLGAPLNIYMLAQDDRQVDTGWVRASTWTQ